MTASDDMIRRGDAEAAIREVTLRPRSGDVMEPACAAFREAVEAIRALPADPVAEAAEAEIVRLRAIEAEAKTYLANMDYCFTAENLTVEDEGHRDASESRLRSLLAKGGAA